MKKLLTIFVFVMFVLSLGFAIAGEDGPVIKPMMKKNLDGTGSNNDANLPDHEPSLYAQKKGGNEEAPTVDRKEERRLLAGEKKEERKRVVEEKKEQRKIKKEARKSQKSCVADLAETKNNCYQESKNAYHQCKLDSKESEDSRAARKLCRDAGKESKESCEMSFGEQRGSCLELENIPEEIPAI
jgi:hypothetical protein